MFEDIWAFLPKFHFLSLIANFFLGSLTDHPVSQFVSDADSITFSNYYKAFRFDTFTLDILPFSILFDNYVRNERLQMVLVYLLKQGQF